MKLSAIWVCLLVLACAPEAGNTSGNHGGAGNIDPSSGGAGGNAGGGGASLGGSSSGNSSVAGANSAGASAAGASAAGSGAGGASGGTGGGGGSSAAGGKAGAASAGSGGNSSAGSAGSGGSMLQDGIKPLFKAGDTTTASAVSAIQGELHVVNTDGGNAKLSLLKVRYYFTNEGTMPMFQINWGQLRSTGSQVNLPYTATVVKLPSAKPTADSYIEFNFSGSDVLDAGKTAVCSFRMYDGTNQPVFHQDNDYSFSAMQVATDKIVLLYRDVVIWGVEP